MGEQEKKVESFPVKIVGAYRIRPEVGEQEKIAASILLVKACLETEQGFPAWENVPPERGKVFPSGKMFPRNAARFSRLGKCSPGTRQGFPARENVPPERGKVFPRQEVLPQTVGAYRIRPEVSEQEKIPTCMSWRNESLPILLQMVRRFRSRGGRMRYAPTYLPFIR